MVLFLQCRRPVDDDGQRRCCGCSIRWSRVDEEPLSIPGHDVTSWFRLITPAGNSVFGSPAGTVLVISMAPPSSPRSRRDRTTLCRRHASADCGRRSARSDISRPHEEKAARRRWVRRSRHHISDPPAVGGEHAETLAKLRLYHRETVCARQPSAAPRCPMPVGMSR